AGAAVLATMAGVDDHDAVGAGQGEQGIEQGLESFLSIQRVNVGQPADQAGREAQAVFQAVKVRAMTPDFDEDWAVAGLQLERRIQAGRELRWFGEAVELAPTLQRHPHVNPFPGPIRLNIRQWA